jgi:hypothetical protein
MSQSKLISQRARRSAKSKVNNFSYCKETLQAGALVRKEVSDPYHVKSVRRHICI